MNKLSEILKGFLWGAGFSIAVIVFGVVYSQFVEPSLGNVLEESEIDEKAVSYLESFNSIYSLTLEKVFVEGTDVRLAIVQQNLTDEPQYAREVLASAFDTNDKFIGNCVAENELFILQAKESAFIEATCSFVEEQVEQIDSFKLKVKAL